jgi:Sulfotransferase family
MKLTSLVKQCLRAGLNRYRAHTFDSLAVRFIVSTGRTGTQFFESFFNNNFPDVLCLHETQPDGFDIAIRKIRGKALPNETVNDLRISRVPILSSLRRRNAKIFIESNPFFSLLIPELRKAFPKALFVWIVRDPKTYVVSAYNKSPVSDGKMFLYGETDHRQRITAMDFPDDRWHKEWPLFDRFQRICWYWNRCNAILEEDLSHQPDFLMVKFEDLFTPGSGYNGIFKMIEFFQITGREPIDNDTLNVMMKRAINSSERILLQDADTWTNEQKLHFDTLTYPMKRKLGY